MADDGAQYRVEVWNASQTEKLEMVSTSSDFAVSLAAGRRRCAAGLDCCLSTTTDRQIMEKLIAPGERVENPHTLIDGAEYEGLDAALRDLRHWHSFRAWCNNCRHHAPMDVETLTRRFGKDVLFSTIEQRLKCSKCKGSGPPGSAQCAEELTDSLLQTSL